MYFPSCYIYVLKEARKALHNDDTVKARALLYSIKAKYRVSGEPLCPACTPMCKCVNRAIASLDVANMANRYELVILKRNAAEHRNEAVKLVHDAINVCKGCLAARSTTRKV